MAKKTKDSHDLIVAGDDPAAAVAALHAAKSGASVLILSPQNKSADAQRLDWFGAVGAEFCTNIGLDAKKIGAEAFKEFQLHSWDLRKHARVDDKLSSGWIVDREKFDAEILKLAAAQGAEILAGADVRQLNLGEDRVICELESGAEAVGRLLIVSGAYGCPAVSLADFARVERSADVAQCLSLEYESKSTAVGFDVAVGASRAGLIASVLKHKKRVRVQIISRDDNLPVQEHFANFYAKAREAELIPEGAPADPVPYISPGGAALDLDTHVGKRCLIIGQVGGFVTAFSHEALYPAMLSGQIAADTALRALKAKLTQDELARFGPAWRKELADYLRMPNTDLSLLVPLVFNNEQMSKRVALAFLLGRPF